MADDGEVVVEEGQTEETPKVEEDNGELDVPKALKAVLKKAQANRGLARGIREAVKALDRKEAHLVVLAESCNEPAYVRLIEALCTEHKVNRLNVPEGAELGEWAGLCKRDKDGNIKKSRGCSCVVVKDFGEATRELDFLIEHFKKQQN